MLIDHRCLQPIRICTHPADQDVVDVKSCVLEAEQVPFNEPVGPDLLLPPVATQRTRSFAALLLRWKRFAENEEVHVRAFICNASRDRSADCRCLNSRPRIVDLQNPLGDFLISFAVFGHLVLSINKFWLGTHLPVYVDAQLKDAEG